MEKKGQLESGVGTQKEWKLIRAPWALQKSVLGAAIEVLETGNADLDDVARAINEKEALRSSVLNVRNQLREFIKRHHHTTFENGGREKLLVDLRRQMDMLSQSADPIPLNSTLRSYEELEEIRRRNAEYDKVHGKDVSQGE